MGCLKGGYHNSFIISWVPLGMIYGGKIVETGCLDLKMV